ncbi:MAG: hypothetical protein ABFD84_05900 [Candidatus Polarisedimenticolia bacterium]
MDARRSAAAAPAVAAFRVARAARRRLEFTVAATRRLARAARRRLEFAVAAPRFADAATRRLARAAVIAGVALAAAFGPALADAPAKPAAADPVFAAERELGAVRGLPFLHPVASRRIAPEQAQALIADEIDEQLPDPDAAARAIALAELRLLPRDFPLKKKIRELLDEQAAGFYDPRTATFYLIDLPPATRAALLKQSGAAAAEVDDVVLVHELDHALTDQHFGLRALLAGKDVEGRDDVQFARQALAEGDATLAMMLVAFRRLGLDLKPETLPSGETLRSLAAQAGPGQEGLAAAPPYLRGQLLEPYLLGLDFVARAWRRGGFAAVDELWRRPPSSTEQLLHPEKRDDPPIAVEPAAREGWAGAVSFELGELGVRAWLETDDASRPAAKDAAAGWGGDRVTLLVRPRTPKPHERLKYPDREDAVVVSTVWDAPADADEFAAAAESWLRAETAPEDEWRIDRRGLKVDVFLRREPQGVRPVTDIGQDPWERPPSELKEKP